MDRYNHSECPAYGQENSYTYLEEILESLDDRPLLDRLWSIRRNGRPGYPLKAMWYAYVSSYYLNLISTNDLIRRLQDDPQLRQVCGFEGDLPHRTTFNRFIKRLTDHLDLIQYCFVNLTNEMKEILPDLGDAVAIDSSAIDSYSNGNRKVISDPEAAWGRKHDARSKNKDLIEWFFGYKVHLIADANHGLPLAFGILPANEHDSPVLPKAFEHGKKLYNWFQPKVGIGDRGYDAKSNHEYLIKEGISPVIRIRENTSKDRLYDGIYTKEGVPTCLGGTPMDYVATDGNGNHLYRCQSEGCHLKDTMTDKMRHCDFVHSVDPIKNPTRAAGPIRRNSDEWEAYYVKRQAVERVFKSMKQSLRLERHYIRGRNEITLHTFMSALIFQANALQKARKGQLEDMRWMVRKVA